MMQYRVLGPVEVVSPAGRVEIASRRQRAVLLTLLLGANRVVAMDGLIEAVWEDNPPLTARTQIYICIAALRDRLAQAGLGDCLETQPPGYLLKVPDGALDLHEFEVLAARGRALAEAGANREAVLILRKALALWRGPAAGGVDTSAARLAAVRLDEDRLAVLEDCLDLELKLGQHRAITSELGQLVDDYPLREKLRSQHVIALYRSGQTASALASLRAARRILRDELGIDPCEELRTLEHQVLVGDVALRRPESAVGETVTSGRRILLVLDDAAAVDRVVPLLPD